jgi:hypothetical protein
MLAKLATVSVPVLQFTLLKDAGMLTLLTEKEPEIVRSVAVAIDSTVSPEHVRFWTEPTSTTISS